jgi:hypothetical protein
MWLWKVLGECIAVFGVVHERTSGALDHRIK